jgi:RimJ/RimL family protein N-acetyltransferase
LELVTRRFLLRDFAEADRPAFLAYHADPRYLAFSGPEESGPDHAERLLQTFQEWAAERPRRNYQLAIVQRKEPGELVGCAGLRAAGFEPGLAELGIELAPHDWGRHGYAVEVGRALLEFGFGALDLREIRSVTVDANARAERLAGWFGAVVVATHPGPAGMQDRGWSQTEWQITRDRWEQARAQR